MGEWLKLGTSASAVDLQLVSDWKPIGLWSAESSFKSALLQQHMSVLQYLHCLAAHRAVASSLHPAWYLAMTRRRRNVSCPCRKPDSAARGRSALRCGRWVMVGTAAGSTQFGSRPVPLARMNRSTDAYTYAAQLEQPLLVVCGGVLTEWRLRLTTWQNGSAARWQLYNGRMVEAWHLRRCCGPPVGE